MTERMTREQALDLSQTYGIPLNRDFHTLNSETVERILAAADFRRYRKPKNAPGSRARMFYQYLDRTASRHA